MNQDEPSSDRAQGRDPGWLSIQLEETQLAPVDDADHLAERIAAAGGVLPAGIHPSGWILNLRRLLSTIRSEAHQLSAEGRRSLEIAMQALYGTGGTAAFSQPDKSKGIADSDCAPRSILGHDPHVLIVGASAEDLQTFFLGLWDRCGTYKLTLVRDAIAARKAIEHHIFDLMIYEYSAANLSEFETFTELYSVALCPPAILVAGDGSEELAAAAFKAGVYDYIPRREMTELLLRRTVIQALRRARLEKELEAANRRLGELVNRDPLTGLHNRRYFEDRLGVEFARAHRYGLPLALVLLDLDHFKKINDTHGHPAGDRVLIETARAMLEMSRQIDLVARIGGEEFALLLPNTDGRGARSLVERVVAHVRTLSIPVGEAAINVTVSAGIAACPDCPAENRMKLFECADQALYQAKQAGRNRVVCFSTKS